MRPKPDALHAWASRRLYSPSTSSQPTAAAWGCICSQAPRAKAALSLLRPWSVPLPGVASLPYAGGVHLALTAPAARRPALSRANLVVSQYPAARCAGVCQCGGAWGSPSAVHPPLTDSAPLWPWCSGLLAIAPCWPTQPSGPGTGTETPLASEVSSPTWVGWSVGPLPHRASEPEDLAAALHLSTRARKGLRC